MADQFSKKLPEFKISLAKIQGHLLKYREDANLALENAMEILQDQNIVDQMSLAEWLERLNLGQYLQSFHKFGLNTVTDMRLYQDEGFLECNLKIKEFIHKKRILSMMQNNSYTVADFQYLTINQARMVLQRKVKDPKSLEELQYCIEDKCITGFQLRDIVSECATIEEIKAAIEKQIERTKNPHKDLRLGEDLKKEETEEEKKKRMGHPDVSAEMVLKQTGLEKIIPNLEENKITDKIFWTLDEGQLESTLKVEVFGARKLLMKKMKEIKDKHEKEFKKSEEQKSEKFMSKYITFTN